MSFYLSMSSCSSFLPPLQSIVIPHTYEYVRENSPDPLGPETSIISPLSNLGAAPGCGLALPKQLSSSLMNVGPNGSSLNQLFSRNTGCLKLTDSSRIEDHLSVSLISYMTYFCSCPKLYLLKHLRCRLHLSCHLAHSANMRACE